MALSLLPQHSREADGRMFASSLLVYLEEDPALIGLLAKSLLGPASGKAVTLTRHASNEMGVGSCETQTM